MNEMRFPDADEILALRAEGHLAASSYFCRIISGMLALIFLFNCGLSALFLDLLSVKDLFDPVFKDALTELLGSFLGAVLIYIGVFSLSALLQTRFYFNPSAIFVKKNKLFSLFRGSLLSRIAALISVLTIVALTLLAFYVWRDLFGLQLFREAGRAQIVDDFLKLCYKIAVVLLILMLPVLAISFMFSKIDFGFRHRVKSKRG